MEVGANSKSSDTLKQLEGLIEGSFQVYELESEKSAIIDELFNSLKIITEFLSYSVYINHEILDYPSDTKIILTPTLDLLIMHPNSKTELKRIDQYSPEKVAQILDHVIPIIAELIKNEKGYLTEKITFLRAATKQLKQARNLTDGKSIESEPAITVEESMN